MGKMKDLHIKLKNGDPLSDLEVEVVLKSITLGEFDALRAERAADGVPQAPLPPSRELKADIARLLNQAERLYSGMQPYADAVSDDPVPPIGEKALSFVVSPARLEEAAGDLEAGFRRLAQRYGRRHAVRWYYWHVLCVAVGGVIRGISRYAKDWAIYYFSRQ